MGRDRDPFDRTIAFMRDQVATRAPLQGALISINGLASTLQVSQTPVREALATLAGEGLIARSAAGYAGVAHDPLTLASHYELAELLALYAIADAGGPWPDLRGAASFEAALMILVEATEQIALTDAFGRLTAQLTPFAAAAALALREDGATLVRLVGAFGDPVGDLGSRGRGERLQAIRGPLRRRRRAAGRILAVSLGLNGHR